MAKQPLAEVFGFPADNVGETAMRYRRLHLCPFNNKVPNCTKDKAKDPLGVCSVNAGGGAAITCPIRFREDWLIAEHAANFFFPEATHWTALTEVRLKDGDGGSAGNIDVVIVSYDRFSGRILDFGALEIQAVYISGNVRIPFEAYMENAETFLKQGGSSGPNSPRPDYLSSSRKRLIPQLMYKGGILHTWNQKVAVALDEGFMATLPSVPEVNPADADIAWLVFSLERDSGQERNRLTHVRTVYTRFEESMLRMTVPPVGEKSQFLEILQKKLDKEIGSSDNPPDNETLDVESV